jgi:hypothetical protein
MSQCQYSGPIIVDASGTTCPSRVSVLPVVEWYFDPLPNERTVKGTSLLRQWFYNFLILFYLKYIIYKALYKFHGSHKEVLFIDNISSPLTNRPHINIFNTFAYTFFLCKDIYAR